ncbi:MAG: glycosyltransferase family 4 protein [Candidatus Riflebacteria bacterium]|nr:glycosyltransferase family 4 protein [Candidatus Riflebacteria bacterium]
MLKVAHLTSVHPRNDNRIFLKECSSLSEAGYSVSFIVADGKGDEDKNGITIYDVGASGGRLGRMFKTTKKIIAKAIALDATVYHLHDPELLPWAAKLKRLGKIVIFDSHEDYPADILTKPYLGKIVRNVVSKCFAAYERKVCRKLDYIVCATSTICNKFTKMGYLAEDINNYPRLSELENSADWSKDRSLVCYMGAITPIRGVWELVEAMRFVKSNARLAIAGVFSDDNIERHCKESPGWRKVEDAGYVSRNEVRDIMSRSAAGLVTYLPAPNHVDSQPNKLFEYMSAGIPVIGSFFPLWREIIEGNHCGICIDPTNPEAIAAAIDYCFTNQAEAREMGLRGKDAVINKYNWSYEYPKLLAIYEKLLRKVKNNGL